MILMPLANRIIAGADVAPESVLCVAIVRSGIAPVVAWPEFGAPGDAAVVCGIDWVLRQPWAGEYAADTFALLARPRGIPVLLDPSGQHCTDWVPGVIDWPGAPVLRRRPSAITAVRQRCYLCQREAPWAYQGWGILSACPQFPHCRRDMAPDGPVLRATGRLEWLRGNLRHRDGGPAVIRPDGRVEWWINGWRLDMRSEARDAGA